MKENFSPALSSRAGRNADNSMDWMTDQRDNTSVPRFHMRASNIYFCREVGAYPIS